VRDAIALLRRAPASTPARSGVADLDEMLDSGGGTDERRANIEELIRLVHEYDGLEPGGTCAGFVAWLNGTVKAEAPDKAGDAVEVATFHRAKGLEWTTVFVAGLEKGLVPIGHATTNAAEAEERRLLYVALTRARERLTCTWAERRSFGGASVPRNPSPYLESIELSVSLMGQGIAPADLRAKIAAERDRLADLNRARRRSNAKAVRAIAGANADPDLLTALKQWRSVIARDAGMPAYLIFHDTTLAAMAEAQPSDEADLLRVPGVGPVKVQRYGADVLRVLHDHRAAS
jgi:DNA helicase-2/ATP-dependent DNA helicase PcrA